MQVTTSDSSRLSLRLPKEPDSPRLNPVVFPAIRKYRTCSLDSRRAARNYRAAASLVFSAPLEASKASR
jgi:hypothetical protein